MPRDLRIVLGRRSVRGFANVSSCCLRKSLVCTSWIFRGRIGPAWEGLRTILIRSKSRKRTGRVFFHIQNGSVIEGGNTVGGWEDERILVRQLPSMIDEERQVYKIVFEDNQGTS